VALLVSLVVVLATAAVATGGYRVTGASMEPALPDGTLVLADPFDRAPDRFDAVVYTPADGRASVKRVIGLPGDAVRIVPAPGGPQVQVRPGGVGDWLRVAGPANPTAGAAGCCGPDGRGSREPAPAVVPDGAYFVLGDNLAVSIDSRQHGFVPAEQLRGRLVLGLLPLRAPAGGGHRLEPAP
jgi:signal peptidase I